MKHERDVRFYPVMLHGIGGGVCLYSWLRVSNEWISGISMIAAFYFFAASGYYFLLHVGYRYNIWYGQYKRIAIQTEYSELARSLYGQDKKALDIIYGHMFEEPIAGLELEDVIYINDTPIPIEWISNHLIKHSKPTKEGRRLPAIRAYSSNSKSQEYARLIQALLVANDLAVPNAGNQSCTLTQPLKTVLDFINTQGEEVEVIQQNTQ